MYFPHSNTEPISSLLSSFNRALCLRTLVVSVTTFTPLSSVIRRLRSLLHSSQFSSWPFHFYDAQSLLLLFLFCLFSSLFGAGWLIILFILTFLFVLLCPYSGGVFGFGFLSSWSNFLWSPFLMGEAIIIIAFSLSVTSHYFQEVLIFQTLTMKCLGVCFFGLPRGPPSFFVLCKSQDVLSSLQPALFLLFHVTSQLFC